MSGDKTEYHEQRKIAKKIINTSVLYIWEIRVEKNEFIYINYMA